MNNSPELEEISGQELAEKIKERSAYEHHAGGVRWFQE